MNKKHTQEQWSHAEHDRTIAGPTFLIRGRSRAIAEVYAQQDAEKYARLISAAPDLLAVVQAYLGTVHNKKGKPDLADVDEMARQAIAKATGVTP